MLFPVLVVSGLVHVFSIDYIGSDPHNQRFFSYLSIFTFFMLILVTGDNYLVMFVGWEGIGISSYLLINFWFTRIQANKSAIKALVVNRVGDMSLSIAFFAIFFALGNLDYSTVFSVAPFINETVVVVIGLLLLFAAMGKSAQLGLHTWLPDAMEGRKYISTNNYSTFSSYNKSTLGAITGCILGDGSIRKSTSKGGNARYNITIKASSKDYINTLRETVFYFCHCSPLIPYPNTNLERHKGKTILQYHFGTGSTDFFTQLHAI